MKKWMSLFLFCTFIANATIPEFKLENGKRIKYDESKWSYQYIKEFAKISAHLLENKSDNNLKVIVQVESHLNSEKLKNEKLLVSKCNEANQVYTGNKSGKAEIVTVSKGKICLITSFKKDKEFYQFVYPVVSSKSAQYDLISFGWYGSINNAKEKVQALVEMSL